MKKWIFSLLALAPLFLSAQPELLRVFDSYRGGGAPWIEYQDLDQAWYRHLHRLARRHLEDRAAELKSCTTLENWESRRAQLRADLLKSIGGLPAKTPLRARTTATLDRPGFTVEKVIYESLPGFYVTACLFLPKERREPAPAIIYCSGHAAEAFRSEVYQRVIINLVQKGFIVLAFDPVGQGERYQYLDDSGQPDIGGPTKEHSYAGLQCLLRGESIARYMIHDGMRAVDYLLSRPEVDGRRIGITGRSGGGTQSAYIAAFDDRIHAAAPENYITSFSRLWASIGPQDAEQNLLSAHVLGIDHGDLLSVRAPRPALMLTTTRDYFSIQGARETFREVQRIYALHGAEEHFSFAEDDHQHGSTRANREAMNAFFQRALDLPGDPTDREVELFSKEELTVTSTGQVVTALDSRTVFDLVQMEEPARPVPLLPASEDRPALLSRIREVVHVQPPGEHTVVFTGRIPKDGYVVEKYFLEFSDGRYPIPIWWVFQPSEEERPVALYLHSEGKEKGLAPAGEIEQLLRAGYDVVAPDLLNTGELAAASFGGDSELDNVSYNLILGSSLVGKSLTALQTEDLFAVAEFIREHVPGGRRSVTAIADGQLCLPLLHYAVLEGGLDQLILRDPLTSWREIVETERYRPRFAYAVVPGALPHYDLPDLLSLWAPRRLRLVHPTNAQDEGLEEKAANDFYAGLRNSYENAGRAKDLIMQRTFSIEQFDR